MIFQYMRDLIRLREAANPRQMLKLINPKESHLIDSAAGLRVRFRLGGVNYYYYYSQMLCLLDVGRFSTKHILQDLCSSTNY